ncbi:ribosome biogenesis protein SLX9-domain-containing protein [Lactifluus subvellereus]|nr:ribosome biogenesis protein SLX9-domain-containing protein [Lactifluus subvellereus]
MPKVRSQRSITRAHTASAKPVNRAFAVQDNAVQHLEIGALKDASADEILHSVDAEDSDPLAVDPHSQRTPNKKERRILKHELFTRRLEASRAPYSKSHARRLKRKEKEHLAGGGMEILKTALPSITARSTTTAVAAVSGKRSAGSEEEERGQQEQDGSDAAGANPDASTSINAKSKSKSTSESPSSHRPQPTRPGQIGEGKGTPLTRSQRRRALKTERFRQPLILANPQFAANPFETLRTHARNTLVPQQLAT